MAEEPTPVENEDKSNDRPFLAALKDAGHDTYLGDMEVVEYLVRLYIKSVVDSLEGVTVAKAQRRRIEQRARRMARIFLGKNKAYVPVHRWNEPGAIDEFCATWTGLAERDPMDRMEHFFVKLFREIMDVMVYADVDGILEEQWEWQLQAIVQRYVGFLLGIDRPMQAIMEEA